MNLILRDSHDSNSLRSEVVVLGTADLMPRNLNRRVEVVFPVKPGWFHACATRSWKCISPIR